MDDQTFNTQGTPTAFQANKEADELLVEFERIVTPYSRVEIDGDGKDVASLLQRTRDEVIHNAIWAIRDRYKSEEQMDIRIWNAVEDLFKICRSLDSLVVELKKRIARIGEIKNRLYEIGDEIQ